MDFTLSFEADELGKALARYAAEQRGRDRRRDEASADHNAEWARFAELGWLTVPFPESAGGSGLGAIGSMIVCEHLGSALAHIPYLSRIVAAGGILAGAGEGDRLAALMDGRSPITAALQDGGGYDVLAPQTSAVRTASGYRLNGTKIHVLGLPTGGAVLVNAAVAGETEPGLFLIDTGGPGIAVGSYFLPDGRPAASIRCLDADLPSACRIDRGNARAVLETVQRDVLVAAAADNLGATQLLYEMTLAYAKTRRQFGRRIGDFQHIQFRLVDLWVKLDEARSLIKAAALAASEDHPQAAELAKQAWIQSLWSGRACGEEAVQIHGAVGMTDEHRVGSFFKRILVNEFLFGPADDHLARCDLRAASDDDAASAHLTRTG